jgi:GT2 family glycosyltransferase
MSDPIANVRASVIICVYNRAEQAKECLDSVLALDFDSFEIVIVDDASTDDTPEHLDRYRQAHPASPISIVRAEHNRGVSGARNLGIESARGEIVFFTDSDCTVDPGWLREMVGELERSQATAVAGRVVTPPPTNLVERAYAGTSRIQQGRHQQRTLSGGNMGLLRAVALDYLFDEALTLYCDETDLAWRLQQDGHRIAYAPNAVVQHNHPLTLRRYLSMAYRQGVGAARYWYKRGVYVGRDVVFLLAAIATLPFAIVDVRALALTALCLALQVAALAYNELTFKGKSLAETIIVLPLCLLYSCCKTLGVVKTLIRLLLGRESTIRESKRRWLARQRRAAPSSIGTN